VVAPRGAAASIVVAALALALAAGPNDARAATPSASVVARVPPGAWVTMFGAPGGSAIAEIGDRTEFGSPTALNVVERRRGWVGVVSPVLRNHRIGWIRERRVRLHRVALALTIDLSARSLVVRREGRIIRHVTVGIGRPSSPTPTGRFSVTDKLPGQRYGAYYGCCILALSAHQPRLPAGWRGGDRIGIHGTDVPSSIGASASAGCLRISDRDLRALMRLVPLGTTVVIRP
jgi:hypothetical protein